MRYFVCFLLLGLLTGCSAQFRRPVCTENLQTVPTELQGTYETVMPAPSARWSNNMILESTVVQIGSHDLQLAKEIPNSQNLGDLCRLKDRVFFQNRNPNGTYGLVQVEKFEQGLILSTLTLDLDEARRRGFKLQYVPKITASVNPDDTSLAMFAEPLDDFIVDNTNIAAEDVLKATKPLSFQIILRKVIPSKALKTTQRIRLVK
ncbi:hypothetical protein D3C87_1316540 [compost metagenome]